MGIEVILAATAVAATGASVYSSQQAAGANRKSMRLQRRQQALQEAKQKRDIIRQGRIAAATATANAENQGASGSSAALGGVGSIRSQVGSNLSFLDQYGRLSDQITGQNISAANYGAQAQLFGDIANLAWMGAGQGPQIRSAYGKAKTAFNGIFNGR